MTKLDLDQYKGYEGYGLQTSSTDDSSVPLWTLDTADRSEIGHRNNASGEQFEQEWTDSLNHALCASGMRGAAWRHSSHRYPFDVSVAVEDVCINFECKSWTRTANHDHGFYESRESYGCRNGKKGRQSQLEMAMNYSRNFDQPVILAIKLSGTDRAHVVPCRDLHKRLKRSPKMPIEEITKYPAFVRKKGRYSVDLAVILDLARGDHDA